MARLGAQAREAEASAFQALVKEALEAGHIAAGAAFAEFVKAAERNPDGKIVDIFGGAWVAVHKPSYRLRKALAALGEIEKWERRGWVISNFSRHVIREQSVTAHRVACEAACMVFRKRFTDDGEFFTHSFRD